MLVAGTQELDVTTIAQAIREAFGATTATSVPGSGKVTDAARHLRRINLEVAAQIPHVAGAPVLSARDLDDTGDELPYAEAATLLQVAHGHGSAILAGTDLCSLLPFWLRAATRSGFDPVTMLVVSEPAETDADTLLGWLQSMIAAEAATRGSARHIVVAGDTGSATEWIALTLELAEITGPAQAVQGTAPGPAPVGYGSLVRRCRAAMLHLAQSAGDEIALRELDSVRSSLEAGLALFNPLLEEHESAARALQASNADLADRMQQSELDMSEALRGQIASSEAELESLHGEIARLRDTTVQMSSEVERLQSAYLAARLARGAARIDKIRTDAILLDHAERLLSKADRPSRGLTGKVPLAARLLQQHVAVVEGFLDDLPWSLVGVHPDGRRQRILAYLIGASDALPDFPIVQNLEYGEMYPDVTGAGMSPLVHFIMHGQHETRRPHPLFDTAWYVACHPEAAHLAASPIIHYLKWGSEKGYDPHPLFHTADYQRRYPDVRQGGINPLVHWIAHSRATATSLFDPIYYLETYPDVADAGRNPLTHYLNVGWREGRNPNPWFDTRFYLAGNPDASVSEVSPLVHYAMHGWRARSAPGPGFDPGYYLANDSTLDSNCDPLRHFLEVGRAEGRRTLPEHVAMPVTAAGLFPSVSPIRSERLKRRATERTGPRIALIVDAFYPRPDQDSGSLDHVNFARIFQQLGYEVHYLALLEFGADHDESSARYRAAMEAMGVHCVTSADHPYIEGYYFANSDRIATCFVSRVHFGGLQIETLRRLCPDAWIIFNTVDLHFVREEREGTLKNEPALIVQARRTREMELDFACQADATIVVSSSEKTMLDELAPEANTHVVPLIRDFNRPVAGGHAGRAGLAFVGGYNHQPNLDAVEFFLAEIWPHVHRRRPDITFSVIGANMPSIWAERSVPGVRFVGFVEDLDTELARLRMTVAPLRYGAGAKGKLVSSLAAGVPAVVSPIASEGMGLVDGETVLVADLGPAFADAIIQLHDDEALWTRLSQAGADYIREHYSIAAGYRLIEAVIPRSHLP